MLTNSIAYLYASQESINTFKGNQYVIGLIIGSVKKFNLEKSKKRHCKRNYANKT
jgi:hypothetical protein